MFRNNRIVFWLCVAGIVLMFACAFFIQVVNAEESEQAPFNATSRAITRTIDQGMTVYWDETVDLRKFTTGNDFMPGIVYNLNDPERLIDINGYTVKIFIDPTFWPVGEYHLWNEQDEPNANTLAFFVEEHKSVPPVNESFINFTGVNETALVVQKLPFEDRVVADIVFARGDPFFYENELISNKSRVWIFGPELGIYNVSCKNGSVYINAAEMDDLEPGAYRFVVDSPGENTISESLYDNETGVIRSPFYWVPEIDTKGLAASVVYDRYLEWMARNSDDEVTTLSLVIQEPLIEITTLYRQHFDLETMRVGGYTNLMNNSVISVSVDDRYFKEGAQYGAGFSTNATSYDYGHLRQWDISIPFDEDNMSTGWHDIVARGNYGAFSKTQYTVYELPAERERPNETFKVIGGNIFIPTPTPVTITNETVKTVEVQNETVRVEVYREPVDYQKVIVTAAEMSLPYIFLGAVVLYLTRVAVKAVARGRRTGNVKESEDGGKR